MPDWGLSGCSNEGNLSLRQKSKIFATSLVRGRHSLCITLQVKTEHGKEVQCDRYSQPPSDEGGGSRLSADGGRESHSPINQNLKVKSGFIGVFIQPRRGELRSPATRDNHRTNGRTKFAPIGCGSSPHRHIKRPAHFFFDAVGAKKKLPKRNALFVGAAHTRKLLKKFDQNFQTRVCANKATNQSLSHRFRPFAMCAVPFLKVLGGGGEFAFREGEKQRGRGGLLQKVSSPSLFFKSFRYPRP